MKPLAALLVRDLRVAVRVGGGALTGVLFFLIVVVLMPFATGPDPVLLARVAPATLWISALLASLLALDRVLKSDYEDGSLDLLLTADTPLELTVATKALAHWLTTGLPLAIAAPFLGLLLNLDFASSAHRRRDACGRHAGADIHRSAWCCVNRGTKPRRTSARGDRAAAHPAGAHFRRRCRRRRGHRVGAVRRILHDPLRADADEPRAWPVRRRRRASARDRVT